MISQFSHLYSKIRRVFSVRRIYGFLSPRAFSVILFAALFCTLAVKSFHSWRYNLFGEYIGWILADISFLLFIEVVLSIVCYRWPRTWIIRLSTITAAVVCTWSVMNAGWLIRTGTQILPRVLLPLIRAPINSFCIIGVNLLKMPIAAFLLLFPSAIALVFLFLVLARPEVPCYNRKRFIIRIFVSLLIILISITARPVVAKHHSSQIASIGMRYNSHLRAVMSLVLPDDRGLTNPRRKIPSFDQLCVTLRTNHLRHNVILVVLEGVQYRYTSLAGEQRGLTPYISTLASQGVEFSNTRSSLTHTTKALFALLTGRFPSASQDIAEAVPAIKPFASIATVLRDFMQYRTAFFQSAMGSFESRPGLVHNLGFDKFWARDDLGDPNDFIGYLGCDEFSMLKPINDWLKSSDQTFFLTILCSVTHDPYEVPGWFDTPSKEPLERYKQSILYTDRFLSALDVEIANLGLVDKTVFCVIGDHGEAFGEHGLLGHERIAFDEVLQVPFCLRAPYIVEAGTKVTEPLSSLDLTPTLLSLLGFETETADFEGINALGLIQDGREVYFLGWMQEGPAGFIKGSRKYIYNPTNRNTSYYDLTADPLELDRLELPEKQARQIADKIQAWRKGTVFRIDQERTGKEILFDRWLCRWNNRVSSAKYQRKEPR